MRHILSDTDMPKSCLDFTAKNLQNSTDFGSRFFVFRPTDARNLRSGYTVEFRNYLLAALPAADLHALLPSLVEVSLERGQVLFEPGDPSRDVFFPSNAVLSVVTVMLDGAAVESSTVGFETAAPLLGALAGDTSRARVFTQIG